ncbi:MAG: hypothetical protein GY941_17300 [Planctomycetes bacterium]|nr:hypothetical protein [Planctomycetota bacterium]
MIFKQKLKAGEMYELGAGKYIKIINSQTDLRLRVFGVDGSIKSNTVVRSGFELTFSEFKYATVQTEVDQPFEIWCSFDPLGYDAPSSNANTMQSYKANHFGDTDPILPFEPNRLTARIVSDAPWWYGGGNVDKENGIPVAAGEIAEVRGAAEISAAISAEGEYLTTTETVDYGQRPWNYGSFSNDYGLVIQDNDGGILLLNENGQNKVPTSGGTIYKMCKVGGDSVAYAGATSDYIYEYSFKTQKTKLISIPNTSSSATPDGYMTRIMGLAYINGVYVVKANCYKAETGDFKALAIYDGESWVYKYKEQGNYTGVSYMWALGDEGLLISSSDKLYFVKIEELPETEQRDENNRIANLDVIFEGFSGNVGYSSITEYGGYMMIKSQSHNSEAALINIGDRSTVSIGNCQIALHGAIGVIRGNGDDWYLSDDLGQTWVEVEPSIVFGSADNVHADFHGGRVFVSSGRFTGYIATEKQRVKVKQEFRVLKAYS